MSHTTNAKRPAHRGKRATTPERPAAAPAPVTRAPARAAAAAGPAAAAPALPAELDIRGAEAAASLLRSAIEAGADRIDASRVAAVDTAGLQLLLAAGRLAAAHGRALRWQNASSTLVEAATRLGVAAVLGLVRTA